MSDFSQICPLFSTGVYSELTIPGPISFSNLSSTMNALGGLSAKASYVASIKFQRTVIVTKVYLQTDTAPGSKPIVHARRHASTSTAAGTSFATLAVTTTSTVFKLGKLRGMTTTAQTFLAADALGFGLATKKVSAGKFAFIVRYKEK